MYGGRTIVGDATLRSPLSGNGIPHGGAATTDGFIFAQARRDKADAYPELARESARHKFLMLGTEVGGRFSEECVDLVRKLVDFKARLVSVDDSQLFKLIYWRRWWGILSTATQRAVAMNLLGGDWAPIIAFHTPSNEELLCTTIPEPRESRMC